MQKYKIFAINHIHILLYFAVLETKQCKNTS